MTGAQDLFKRFRVSDSSMYKELGMRPRHVVHGSGPMVFQVNSGGVLRVEKCVMGARTMFSASRIEE
jgi:hypothetical protein